MIAEEYLKLSQEERQIHLDKSLPCIERGGNSTNHRGVLAQFLDTPIFGRPADLCHACHNDKCSNPKHLYWGTRTENIQDAKDNGTWKSAFERLVDKHGYERAVDIVKENGSSGWSKGGKANKGKPKTEDHKAKVSASLKARNGGMA